MAVKIRLARGGSKKRPFYRIVAADSRMPRDGRFIEKLGTYNPLLAKDSEDRVKMDIERIQYWLSQGAQVTDRVSRFLEAAEIIEKKSAATSRRAPRAKKLRTAPRRKPPKPLQQPKPLQSPPRTNRGVHVFWHRHPLVQGSFYWKDPAPFRWTGWWAGDVRQHESRPANPTASCSA